MSTVDLTEASDDEDNEIEYVGTLPADLAEAAAALAPPSSAAPSYAPSATPRAPDDAEGVGEAPAEGRRGRAVRGRRTSRRRTTPRMDSSSSAGIEPAPPAARDAP